MTIELLMVFGHVGLGLGVNGLDAPALVAAELGPSLKELIIKT